MKLASCHQAGILRMEKVAKRISNNQLWAGHAPSLAPQMDQSPPQMDWSAICVLLLLPFLKSLPALTSHPLGGVLPRLRKSVRKIV